MSADAAPRRVCCTICHSPTTLGWLKHPDGWLCSTRCANIPHPIPLPRETDRG